MFTGGNANARVFYIAGNIGFVQFDDPKFNGARGGEFYGIVQQIVKYLFQPVFVRENGRGAWRIAEGQPNGFAQVFDFFGVEDKKFLDCFVKVDAISS